MLIEMDVQKRKKKKKPNLHSFVCKMMMISYIQLSWILHLSPFSMLLLKLILPSSSSSPLNPSTKFMPNKPKPKLKKVIRNHTHTFSFNFLSLHHYSITSNETNLHTFKRFFMTILMVVLDCSSTNKLLSQKKKKERERKRGFWSEEKKERESVTNPAGKFHNFSHFK